MWLFFRIAKQCIYVGVSKTTVNVLTSSSVSKASCYAHTVVLIQLVFGLVSGQHDPQKLAHYLNHWVFIVSIIS